MQRVFVPMHGKTPDEAKIKEALAGLEQTLAVLDTHLATNQYLAGGPRALNFGFK
jgi:glutathione S-transferase